MERKYYVYIMTNRHNSVLYTGVTNNISRRTWEHREGAIPGFTKKYRVNKLVYVEICNDVNAAIYREKQIKGWLRYKKIELISAVNKNWDELEVFY